MQFRGFYTSYSEVIIEFVNPYVEVRVRPLARTYRYCVEWDGTYNWFVSKNDVDKMLKAIEENDEKILSLVRLCKDMDIRTNKKNMEIIFDDYLSDEEKAYKILKSKLLSVYQNLRRLRYPPIDEEVLDIVKKYYRSHRIINPIKKLRHLSNEEVMYIYAMAHLIKR